MAALRGLQAPLGCFFVTGNHEYFYRAREWVEHLRSLGCTVLLNAHQVVEREGGRLLIAGVCDEAGENHRDGHPHDLEGAIAHAPAARASSWPTVRIAQSAPRRSGSTRSCRVTCTEGRCSP